MRTYPQSAGASRRWGQHIKQILRSRLPERFSGKLPPVLVEVAIGLGLPALLTLLRIAFFPLFGDGAPFAQVFVGVVGATVLAGWRSGLMALAAGQFLAWYYVVGESGNIPVTEQMRIAALFLSSCAEMLALVIISLYQREIARAWSKRESQMGLLQEALQEIDHRTSNNYQTVLALIVTQAKSATDPMVKEALQQVGDRIRAIANASRKLAVASESLEQVRIAEHLHDLCDEIEKGLSRPGIRLECDIDDIMLGADQTVSLSILINEFVTNALKHAFPDDRGGTIRVALAGTGGSVELSVTDDGVGFDRAANSRGTGLGTRLVETFVKQLRAKHDVASGESGTRHRVRFARRS